MPDFPARLLRIILFLLPVHSCFAATIYVNVNNATPGTGGTWGAAYADLSLALGAAAYGDQVWVAKGTYKPTTGTDRTISFLLNAGVSLYGGFSGVETALGQRNWTTNVTILSGDIGVVGDASDNSYSVVTITNNHSSATIDGFTVRDGNANANYPASTALQPYNQGGGILCPAGVNGYVGGIVDHCILTANFAVYGGGFCAYANGTGSVIEMNLYHDLFLGNQSVFGGGVAYLSTNGGAGLTSVESCIFNANVSLGGGASAVAGVADANSALCSFFVQYSTFYNNAAPVLTKTLLNGGTMNYSMTGCILWQAAGFYASPVTTGAVTISTCNLDLATPGSGNTNSDPKFVNAAGNDFHLQPCSPDIDAGGFALPNSPYDYDGNARVQNSSIDLGAYESAPGSSTVSPTISVIPTPYCEGASAAALTVPGGTSLLWYPAATGGVGVTTAPVPVTTSVGTIDYWVTQTVTGECESNRFSVPVVVSGVPAAPVVAAVPVSYCEGATAAALTASGTSLLWYTAATGGLGGSAAPVPSTGAVGMQSWYVSQTSGCESPRAEVDVVVSGVPAAPVVAAVPVSYCEGATAAALTASGTSLLWYTAATGGVGGSAAPVPSTGAVGMQSWYVSQTSGCESPRAEVDVVVNGVPAAPGVATVPVSYCVGSAAAALTASGTSLLWYTAATGGVGGSAAPVPSTGAVGMQSWYVSQTSGCESPRAEVDVVVNGVPAAPVVATVPVSYCVGSAAAALTASGTSLLWYTAATGGVGGSAAPVPSTGAVGMQSWYVSQTSGCESPRAEVDVVVNGVPAAPVVATVPVSYCEGATATALTATVTGTGTGLLWYTAATGGVGGSAAPVPSTAGVGTQRWYVSETNGCESPRAEVDVVVNALPVVAIGSVPAGLCAGGSVVLDASGAASYQWSPATGLSDVTSGAPTVMLQGNIEYTVTGTDVNGCAATAQVALTVGTDCQLGYYIPNAFSPNGDGNNDIFRVRTGDSPKSFRMLVFNRFGGKVFESLTISEGWNGMVGGSPLSTGTYVYVIAITTSAGAVIEKKGTLELVR